VYEPVLRQERFGHTVLQGKHAQHKKPAARSAGLKSLMCTPAEQSKIATASAQVAITNSYRASKGWGRKERQTKNMANIAAPACASTAAGSNIHLLLRLVCIAASIVVPNTKNDQELYLPRAKTSLLIV